MKSKDFQKQLLKHKTIIAVALIAVILLALVPTGLNTYVPGPEGPNAIAYGASFRDLGNKVYFSGTGTLPNSDSYSTFKWAENQPSIMGISHVKWGNGEKISTLYETDDGTVMTEVQDMTLDQTNVKTVEFSKYVKISDTQYKVTKITGSIATATFKIGIYSDPGEGWYTFEGVQLWYNLDTVKWTNAFIDDGESFAPTTNATTVLQEAVYRGAYPLNAIIDDYQIVGWVKGAEGTTVTQNVEAGAQAKTVLSPSLEGRNIDLFTEPSLSWDKVTNYQAITDQQMLSLATKADALPDGRFSEDVYFYINLDSFGAYVKDGGLRGRNTEYYPSVEYTIKVQYVVYGEFVYLWTKEAAKDVGMDPDKWETRNSTVIYYQSPISGFWDDIGSWWSGNSLPVYMIMVIVILVLVVYLAGPLIRGIGQSYQRRGGKK